MNIYSSKILSKYHIAFLTFILMILIYSAYCNTFQSPPLLDDFHSFVNEPLVKIQHWTIDRFLSISDTKFGWKRFIPMLTFAVDISIGKGKFFYLHLTNFMIHLVNVFCIIFFVSRLIQHVRENNLTREPLPDQWNMALWVAGIWALQPIQASAVTYLVQRMTSLMTLFYILSVACYFTARSLQLREKALNSKVLLFYFSSFITAMLAFLSKENSAMLPVMLFCTEVWFFQQDLPKRIFKYSIKHWFFSFSIICLSGAVGLYVLSPIMAGYDVRDFTLTQRMLTETRIIIWYISLLLWPNPNRFSIEHDIDLSTSLINPYTTLLSSITIFIIIISSIFYKKKYPLITYGIIWFFLNLAIESSIIPLELIFEHRVYLPSVGITISFVLILYYIILKIFKKLSDFDFKIAQWCFFILLFSLMTLVTYDRNNFFYDTVLVNQHNINNAPGSPRSYANLAVSLARIGKNEEAIEKARYTIGMGKENNSSYYVAANTILLAYENMGQPYKGLKEAEKLLDEQPPNASRQGLMTICSNLAAIYAKMEDYKGAVYSIQRLLLYAQKLSGKEIDVEDLRFPMLQYILHEVQRKNLKLDLDGDGTCDPGNLPTKTWVARFLLSMGFEAKAKELLCKSKNEYPGDATALNLLKNLEANENLNRTQSAKWSFREKYVNHPFSRFNACMATAYLIRKCKLPSPFITLGENLLSYCETLQPSAADVQLLRGWYYFEKRQLDQAIASVNLALKLDNNNSKAYLALGLFLTDANQIEGSIDAFRTCLKIYPGCPERIILQDLIKDLEKKLTDASVVHPLANMNVDSEVLGSVDIWVLINRCQQHYYKMKHG